jgi:hypothetical protein
LRRIFFDFYELLHIAACIYLVSIAWIVYVHLH